MRREICRVRLIEKKRQELMSLLGLKNTLNGIAKVSGVRWYGHVLRKVNGKGIMVRRTLDFEVAGRRGRERSNMAWKRQVEKHTDQMELKKEDATDRTKWRIGVFELSRNTDESSHLRLRRQNWI